MSSPITPGALVTLTHRPTCKYHSRCMADKSITRSKGGGLFLYCTMAFLVTYYLYIAPPHSLFQLFHITERGHFLLVLCYNSIPKPKRTLSKVPKVAANETLCRSPDEHIPAQASNGHPEICNSPRPDRSISHYLTEHSPSLPTIFSSPLLVLLHTCTYIHTHSHTRLNLMNSH